MKKNTQKSIMALTIVLLFGMSSIAFVVTSISGPPPEEFKPLETFVVDYELDPRTEYEYLTMGFTIFKFYHTDQVDQMMVAYIDQLPNIFRTSNNQIQMIVEKISDNRTYARVLGVYGEEEIENLTESNIFDTLCNNLYIMPLECGLRQINITN